MSQSGRNAHGILFGNAALHKLLGQRIGKVAQRHRATGVGSNGNDIFILTSQLQQRVSELFSACNHLHSVHIPDKNLVYTDPEIRKGGF